MESTISTLEATPRTVANVLAGAEARLARAGVDTARLDAELLLAKAFGFGRAALLARLPDAVPRQVAVTFKDLLQRRWRREPLAYITGEREFWSLPFTVAEGVLIPRPETEVLVEAALVACRSALVAGRASRVARILDVGTGSGCIAVALAREWPQARLVAIDVSAAALTVAAANLARHSVADRVALVRADIRDVAFAEPFDLIVANPPYVPTAALDRLQPEVAGWEPRLALDGGTDGLDAVRLLLNRAPDLLRPGGALLVEIAGDQAGEVVALARAGGRFEDVEVTPDYSGLPRLVSARLHEPRWVSERRP